jgi:hypothetical protein
MQLFNTRVSHISVRHCFLSLNKLDGRRAHGVYDGSARAFQNVNLGGEASTLKPLVHNNTGPDKRFLVHEHLRLAELANSLGEMNRLGFKSRKFRFGVFRIAI